MIVSRLCPVRVITRVIEGLPGAWYCDLHAASPCADAACVCCDLTSGRISAFTVMLTGFAKLAACEASHCIEPTRGRVGAKRAIERNQTAPRADSSVSGVAGAEKGRDMGELHDLLYGAAVAANERTHDSDRECKRLSLRDPEG